MSLSPLTHVLYVEYVDNDPDIHAVAPQVRQLWEQAHV